MTPQHRYFLDGRADCSKIQFISSVFNDQLNMCLYVAAMLSHLMKAFLYGLYTLQRKVNSKTYSSWLRNSVFPFHICKNRSFTVSPASHLQDI